MPKKSLPRIVAVTADKGPLTLRIRWDKAEESRIDLSGPIETFRVYEPLRRSPGLFARARVGEHGTDIVWTDEIDMAADTLWRLAQEQAGVTMSPDAFRQWRERKAYTLDTAARALGVSRRMVAYYEQGAKPIPRVVALATRALELARRMMSGRASGTEGYAENAATLIQSWRRLSFSGRPEPVLDLLPLAPSLILDVGAGIGVDAAALAAMGHQVVAVEPTDELRLPGMGFHKSTKIEWIADSLPNLDVLWAESRSFDLIMLTAVWMHLDELQRQRAMPRIAAMIRPGGRMIMSLRHGPAPHDRRMFDVTAEETIQLAAAQHLQPIVRLKAQSVQKANRLMG